MPDLRKRSYQKELLDADDIPFEDIRQTMEELDSINTLLGGHAITLRGFKKLLGKHHTSTVIRVCEIGCGGGDNLRVLKKHCEENNIPAHFMGVDINPKTIAFARERPENKGIEFKCSDYRAVQFEQEPGIIFSSLFCHHFTDEQLHEMPLWLKQHSTIGFYINDLHRHPLAYWSIKYLTKLFSKSSLVINDAPLSVHRSFTKEEWVTLLQNAGIDNAVIEWHWAFRWLVLVKTIKQ